MPKTLTDAAVRKYRGGKTRREIRDGGAQGLFLIVQPSGAKSWALRYRRSDGRSAKLTLGPVDFSGRESDGDPLIGTPLSLAAVRALAAEQHRQRKRGIDVAAVRVSEKRRKAQSIQDTATNTFAALARRFVDEHARVHTRRWNDTARYFGLDYSGDAEPAIIKGGLADRWRDRQASTIDSGDLYAVVDEARRVGIPGLRRRRSRTSASDAQGRAMAAALSKLFSWLVEHRRITTNPAIGMYKPPPLPARDRVLNEAEIKWFWSACETLGQPFAPLLKLLLLTGCRLNEIAGMTLGEVRDDGTVWTIPGARTKNHRAHVVPPPPLAREILGTVPRVEGKTGLVFTTTGNTPVSGWSKLKRRLDAAMLACAREERGADATIPPWRLHDLRRTLVTGMNDLGVAPHVVEAVVNHISGHKGGVAGVCNRSQYLPERKAALERWAAHIAGPVMGTPDNIVPLRAS